MVAGMKLIASCVMGSVGFFMLLRGKKIANPSMMVWGGVLMVLSYWLF